MGNKTRLFGTDGIRGRAHEHPLTPEFATAFGRAIAAKFGPAGGPLVIGRDTRISGPMLEQAVAAGAASMGVDVVLPRRRAHSGGRVPHAPSRRLRGRGHQRLAQSVRG